MPSAGFTVIEILVVVLIVGIMAGVATLAVGPVGADRRLELAAERLNGRLRLACEEAVLTGRPLGLGLRPDGYAVWAYARGDSDVNWQPYTVSDVFGDQAWPDGVRVELSVDGDPVELDTDTETPSPQIVCQPGGELSPFELTLEHEGVDARYLLRGAFDQRLSLAREGRDG